MFVVRGSPMRVGQLREQEAEGRRQKAEGRRQYITAYCLCFLLTSLLTAFCLLLSAFRLLSVAVPDLFLCLLLASLCSRPPWKLFRIAGGRFLNHTAFISGNLRERAFG